MTLIYCLKMTTILTGVLVSQRNVFTWSCYVNIIVMLGQVLQGRF